MAHVGIASHVARAQADGLRVDAGVGRLVGVMHVGAAYRARFVDDQLFGEGSEHEFRACGKSLVAAVLAAPLHVGVEVDGAVEEGIVLLLVVVPFQRRPEDRA